MFSRLLNRLESHAMRLSSQTTPLSLDPTRLTVRRIPREARSRIDSTFFRPSLARKTSRSKVAHYEQPEQHKAKSRPDTFHWSIFGAVVTLYYADTQFGTSRRAIDGFLGRDPMTGLIHLEAKEGDTETLSRDELQFVVDPDTQQALPLYLAPPISPLPPSSGKLKLVGLGVRTVSFLRVKVYVAGLYMDEAKVNAVLAQGGLKTDQTLEDLVKTLLDQGTATVIRIVPVRNTDFSHLRDGFIRALQGRLKKAVKEDLVQSGSDTEKAFEESIQQIKDSFPRGSVAKGSALNMVIATNPSTERMRKNMASTLNFEYEGQVFGEVTNGNSTMPIGADTSSFSVARELVLAYFASKGEISSALKKSVQSEFSKDQRTALI